MQRTVRPDATLVAGGAVFEPSDLHSSLLMKQWIGTRVKVRDYNYWGTEKEAALRFPALDERRVAKLRIRSDSKVTRADGAEETK